MKLSFSTNRWSGFNFDDFLRIAKEYKFHGIEIHSIDEMKDETKNERLFETYHKLIENKKATFRLLVITMK